MLFFCRPTAWFNRRLQQGNHIEIIQVNNILCWQIDLQGQHKTVNTVMSIVGIMCFLEGISRSWKPLILDNSPSKSLETYGLQALQ